MKINEQKLADACVNHGWVLDLNGCHADIHNGVAEVKIATTGRKILIDGATGPFGAVNAILRGIESCVEEG